MVQTIEEYAPPEVAAAQDGQLGVFLIQHDWGSLLAGADVDAGEVRLPFDYSVFEMEIGGRRVCALLAAADGAPYRLIPIVRARGGWMIVCSYEVSGARVVREGWPAPDDDDYTHELGELVMAQVRAIAITLDAEVVRADLVRERYLSNTPRKGSERKPYDHHVLSLVKRYHNTPASLPGAPGHHKRLHFRRGHWRHYPSHKTWIRWCLVGDPSLGFADKDYAL